MKLTLHSMLLVVLLVQLNIWKIAALIKFTALKCESLDKSLGDFQECKIKAVSRKKSLISINFKANRLVNDCNIHFAFMKKANGWKPFLYDTEVNMCEFLKNRRRYILPNVIYNYVKNFTNVIHNCPYEAGEELSATSFELDEGLLLKQFPLDMGEYALFTKWYSGKKLRVLINGSASITDYRKYN